MSANTTWLKIDSPGRDNKEASGPRPSQTRTADSGPTVPSRPATETLRKCKIPEFNSRQTLSPSAESPTIRRMKITNGLRRTWLLGGACLLAFALPVHARQDAPSSTTPGAQPASAITGTGPIRYPPPETGLKGLAERTWGDTKAYFTAPLRWHKRQWEYFGGALAAIAVAHHYDTQVRTHFDQNSKLPLGPKPSSSSDFTDALPGFAAFAATWGYAELIDSHAGKSEAWNMLESAGLSFVSAYAIKYAIGRQRPFQTTSANQWFKGGASFPSEHVTAAFAIGTVLAESGNPRYRWIRRTLGYGIGAFTAYQRMKHNAHWLSDTVAGAALGIATAHFVMDRSAERENEEMDVSVVPVRGGVMLAYSADFN